jgi:ferritin-like metal-binding protein YciE
MAHIFSRLLLDAVLAQLLQRGNKKHPIARCWEAAVHISRRVRNARWPHRCRQDLRRPPPWLDANLETMRFTSLKLDSLRDLLVEQLRDLYSAETQLVEALPKMTEAASSQELKSAFEHHLQQTYEHVSRLKDIFGDIGEKSSGEACEAMKGLIKEGEILLKAEGDPDVRDAGLIGAAQRVEHYEIAGYGTARSLAQRLGDSQVAGTLQLTLNEEAEADKKLTSIAEGQVNISAASGQRR